MKSIWRRLMYYGIGLMFGLLFVTLFFGNRGCTWLPENRVKASVFSQIIVIDTNAMLAEYTDSMYVVALADSKVNFGLSARQGEPKAYYFGNTSKKKKGTFFQVTFETDGVVAVCQTIAEDRKAKIAIGDHWFPIIHVPGDSNFISFHEDVLNEINNLKINRNQIHRALRENGMAQTVHIDLDPDQRKIHRMTFAIGGQQYNIRARYFQNSLQLLDVEEIFSSELD